MKETLYMVDMKMGKKYSVNAPCGEALSQVHHPGIDKITLFTRIDDGTAWVAAEVGIDARHGTGVTIAAVDGHPGGVSCTKQGYAHLLAVPRLFNRTSSAAPASCRC